MQAGGSPWLPLLAWLGACALVAGMLRQAWQVPPQRLRWDGRQWWLQRQGEAADEGLAVNLELVADLQRWMLLRWQVRAVAPAVSSQGGTAPLRPPGAAQGWIAVEPASLDLPWHAWRCAVHGARPAQPETLA